MMTMTDAAAATAQSIKLAAADHHHHRNYHADVESKMAGIGRHGFSCVTCMLNSEHIADRYIASVTIMFMFYEFCHSLELIEKSGKNGGKQRNLDLLWEKACSPSGRTPAMCHLLLRLLLPDSDSERPSYNMKQPTMAKLFLDVLQLAKGSADHTKLSNYEKADKGAGALAGDFARVVEEVMQLRCAKAPRSSSEDVDAQLTRLAKAACPKEQKDVAQWFVTNCTAQEIKWIVRLVLKKLQIGCSDSTILKHFHVDAEALFNSCMSIRRVAEELFDPKVRLHVRAVNFGQAMRPMLADKVHLSTLLQDIREKEIVIETKLDGERLLLHYEQASSSLFLFSRQGTDYSEEYGRQLKPIVKQHCLCSSCVLDGEVLAWNEADQDFEDFGSLKTVAAGDGRLRHLCFVAFDVLMLNGAVVTDQTLRQRRQLLEACVQPRDSWFYCVQQLRCDSVDTVKDKLQEACERQEEGIVLKDLNSKYLPGERSTAWSKLKLDCLDNMSHDLDLVVIGASYSKSRGRHGALYDLLLGVRVESVTSDCIATSFVRVGSGLSFKGSDEQSFVALAKRLEPHWKDFDPKQPPPLLQLKGGAKERPDKWIDPRDSVVLEVRADYRFIESQVYSLPFSLRFPRIKRVRYDKSFAECMSDREARDLFESSKNDPLQNLEFSTANMLRCKKSPSKKRAVPTHQVAGSFRRVDVDVGDVGELVPPALFSDIEACVLGEDDARMHIIKLLKAGGAHLMTSKNTLDDGVRLFSCDTTNARYRRYAALDSANRPDIMHSSYITECVAAQALLEPRPKCFLLTSAATSIQLAKDYDQWGDPDDEDTSMEDLRDLLPRVAKAQPAPDCSSDGKCGNESDSSRYDGYGLLTFKRRLQQHTRLFPFQVDRTPLMQKRFNMALECLIGLGVPIASSYRIASHVLCCSGEWQPAPSHSLQQPPVIIDAMQFSLEPSHSLYQMLLP